MPGSGVTIKWETRELDRMLGAGDKAYERAAVTTLNRAGRSMRARVRRQVANRENIRPMKLINKRFLAKRARVGHYVFLLRFLLRPVPAIKLKGATVRDYSPAWVGWGGKTKKRRHIFSRRGTYRTPVQAEQVEIEPSADAAMQRELLNAVGYVSRVLPGRIMYELDRASR